jgi:hypothetical protein
VNAEQLQLHADVDLLFYLRFQRLTLSL